MTTRTLCSGAALVAAIMLGAATAAAAQGALWVVDDDGPGAAFTDIQPAIDAAADGDVVFVRDGIYTSFTIDGRSLAVIGEDGGNVQVYYGTVTVRNIGAAQSVLLRGFDRIATGWFFEAPTFTDCAGLVWVEDCWFLTSNMGGLFHPDAVVVNHCDALVFTHCLTTASQMFAKSGAGLNATASSIACWDTPLTGRDGTVGGAPHDGGDGVIQDGGFLFASGCAFLGGAGGKGVVVQYPTGSFCTDGGNGGNGLSLSGAAPLAVTLDCSFAGGAASTAAPACTPGAAGAPQVVVAGHVSELAGQARSLRLGAKACEGGSIAFELHGAAFEPVVLAVSRLPRFQFLPGLGGVLLAGVPHAVIALGTLSASGELVGSLPVPHLPAAVPDAQLLYVQPAFLVQSGTVALGAPSALALIKAAACP